MARPRSPIILLTFLDHNEASPLTFHSWSEAKVYRSASPSPPPSLWHVFFGYVCLSAHWTVVLPTVFYKGTGCWFNEPFSLSDDLMCVRLPCTAIDTQPFHCDDLMCVAVDTQPFHCDDLMYVAVDTHPFHCDVLMCVAVV